MPAPLSDAYLHLFCRTRGPRVARRERPLRSKPVVEVHIRTLYGSLGSNRPAVPKLQRSVRIRCLCLLRVGGGRSLLPIKNPRTPWSHQRHWLLGARHNADCNFVSHPRHAPFDLVKQRRRFKAPSIIV